MPEIKKSNRSRSCPKCGNRSKVLIVVEYCYKKTCKELRRIKGVEKEHLHKECLECNYTWLEECVS